MLTAEQIREKIFAKAKEFDEFCYNKEWTRAKYAYDVASAMSVFAELPDEDMQVLFCVREKECGEEIPPLFDLKLVQKAYWECIKANQSFERKPYPGNPANLKDYADLDPWTRKERQERSGGSPYKVFDPAPRRSVI